MKALIVYLSAVIALGTSALAQDAKNEPLTTADALKLDEESLTKYTGMSEVGQDEAAELYATAKRITTEQELGQKDLRMVMELDRWRNAVSKCRGSIYSLAYDINGGGTMYSHAQRRDISTAEAFLAKLAKSLPLASAKGDEKVASVIDRAIAVFKNLRAAKGQKSQLAEAVKEAAENFTNLKYRIADIPASDAKKIVMFATDPIGGWLLNDDERADKFEESREVLKP